MTTNKIIKKFKPNLYEKQAWQNGELVIGIDEVGRSCLAGPVVAAAVILNPGVKHKFLKDSKLLTARERAIAYKWLEKNAKFAVGCLHHRKIDSVNIYNATLVAMKRAIHQLIANTQLKPSCILIDAMPVKIDFDNIDIFYFYKGESLSKSVAAASIIAKVTRDLLMTRLDHFFPDYALFQNKGYGTKQHRNSLTYNGSTIIHRKSFLKTLNKQNHEASDFNDSNFSTSNIDSSNSKLSNSSNSSLSIDQDIA